MAVIQVTNYKEILEAIGANPNSDVNPHYYRGLRKGFTITPSIAYPDTLKKLKVEGDFRSYEEKTIIAFHSHLKEGFGIDAYKLTDWNLWFLARHFGLKSRLTDFTKDISVAFQFATEMSGENPCLLYCLDSKGITQRLQEDLGDPFTYNEVCLIQPSLKYRETMERIGVSRMFIQMGKFLHQPIGSVQTPLIDQINQEHWKVLEIQPKYFDAIREELQKEFDVDFSKPLVTTHAIDGICYHINSSHLS